MSYDITSPGNERIKWLVRLRQRKHRDAESVFLVEGVRLYDRAVSAGLEPLVTFVTGDVASRGETVTVPSEILDKASYRNRSQGLIGVFPQFDTALAGLEIGDDPLLLIAEGIEKPGNLGAMLRTAAAAGAEAVVVVGEKLDVFNPNVLRSSTGALFEVPVVVSAWVELDHWLSKSGVAVVATSPDAPTPLWETDLAGPTALLIGAEDDGLSEHALSRADRTISIPQHGGTTDSLNASVAAGIVLFEAVRQRAG